MLTRSQALGTRVRVGPLWVLLGGLLLGSPTRLGPAVPRRPGCLWSHPDTPPVASAAPPASRRCPRTPPPSSPLYLGLWGRGLLTRARTRSAQGPAGAQQPRTPWRHMALELGFQALWGAQGAAWQVCGPDGRPGAPSTSQKTRQAGAAPLASGATAPGHRLHGARCPPSASDTCPDTRREHPACSSRRRAQENRQKTHTARAPAPVASPAWAPSAHGTELGLRLRKGGLLFTAAARGRPCPCWDICGECPVPGSPAWLRSAEWHLPGRGHRGQSAGPTSSACPVLSPGSVGVTSHSPASAASSPLAPGSQAPASWARPEAAFSCDPFSWLGPRAAPGVQGGQPRCPAESSRVRSSGLHTRPPVHVALEEQGHVARSHAGQSGLASSLAKGASPGQQRTQECPTQKRQQPPELTRDRQLGSRACACAGSRKQRGPGRSEGRVRTGGGRETWAGLGSCVGLETTLAEGQARAAGPRALTQLSAGPRARGQPGAHVQLALHLQQAQLRCHRWRGSGLEQGRTETLQRPWSQLGTCRMRGGAISPSPGRPCGPWCPTLLGTADTAQLRCSGYRTRG